MPAPKSTVSVGDIVLWSPDRNGEEATPAIVFSVGSPPQGFTEPSLDLTVFYGPANPAGRFGVRHQGDPRPHTDYSEGFWRFKPRDLELDAVLSHLRQNREQPKK